VSFRSAKASRILVVTTVLALAAGACTGGATPSPSGASTAPSGEKVVVCELAYYTGEFAD